MSNRQGIGAILLIGLVLWLVLRKSKEYELLHRAVPITSYTEKTIPVFTSFEEYQKES